MALSPRVRLLPWEESPWNITSAYVKENHVQMGIDPLIVDLVCVLLDTGVVGTHYSCEGHFSLQHPGSFCHHNQKAQVQFRPKELTLATALCDEILRSVVVDSIDVSVSIGQNKGDPDDEVEVDWCLEYRPRGFWEMRPQDSGMLITVAPGWTERKARRLLDKAFKATINVCRKGLWRESSKTTDCVQQRGGSILGDTPAVRKRPGQRNDN